MNAPQGPTTGGDAAAPLRLPEATLPWADVHAIQQLYAAYAQALDTAQWARWPQFFTPDGVYRLVPRENHERGFPLATLAFEGQGMMQDRVYGIVHTLFHDPYYQRHVLGVPLITAVQGDTVQAEASYAVFRTKLSEPSTVFNVGRTLDTLQRTAEGWRFAQRLCVYDSELIPNAIIYPV